MRQMNQQVRISASQELQAFRTWLARSHSVHADELSGSQVKPIL